MKQFLSRISGIGILPTDDETIRLRKQFLIYQGIGMSIGGLGWGTMLLAFSYPNQSVIPYGYVVLTAINLFFFYKTKNFVIVRNFQTMISMFLPFFLQWYLGGFVVSGGVMLWSILAMVSSISYQNVKSSVFWLIIYLVLTGISFWLDSYFSAHFNMEVSAQISKIFQYTNVVAVSILILLLFIYFVSANNANMELVKKTYSKLITSEKLAALGQVAAGVAHEVNTPLGAIKSSAEESGHAFMEVLVSFLWMSKTLNEKDKDMLAEFIATANPSRETLSTKEEREIKKKMRDKFATLGIENSNFLSDRLVQVGIHEVSPALEQLAKHEHFEKMVMMTYNILNQQRSNQTIQLAVDKASRIVKALKTYLHTSGSEEMVSVNVRDNMETVLTIYHNRLKQGIKVIKNYDEVPEVFGHPDKLNQVWTNLIVNAVQAMDVNGILTIGMKKEGEYVTVSIKDTGKGIPAEIQDKIFEPFFTTKISGEGSGLGLDIIKHILDEHSAKISFESTVGEGTTFFVKLPLNQKA